MIVFYLRKRSSSALQTLTRVFWMHRVQASFFPAKSDPVKAVHFPVKQRALQHWDTGAKRVQSDRKQLFEVEETRSPPKCRVQLRAGSPCVKPPETRRRFGEQLYTCVHSTMGDITHFSLINVTLLGVFSPAPPLFSLPSVSAYWWCRPPDYYSQTMSTV